MKTALIILLLANVVPEIHAQCSAIMVPLSGGPSCSASSACASAAPGYFCFQGACCGVQMNCNAGQVVALTDPDMTPVPCSNCPTGFTCVNSMCCAAASSGPGPTTPPTTSCGTNQVLVNGACLNLGPIGSACAADAQCQGGSFCTTGTCTCPNGFSNNNGVCSSAPPPTSCSTGQVLVNGACLSIVSVNGPCTVQAQCPSGTTCTNNVCACPTGSSVVNGACSACQANQVSVNGQCFPAATHGTTCTYNEQCSFTNGRCLNGMCACNSGFTYNGVDCNN
uniref:EB domain-containing protein n=1 Tax=Plectus sambesii TaxID=2011161 RepID=A0A914WZ37_9BILA